MKAFILGIVIALIGLAAGVYLYFYTGQAPVATSSKPMPFERTFARMGLHAYLDRKPHLEPQVPANEQTYLAGAQIYKEHCAVCHGLPGSDRTAIAAGMAPKPPQLFKGVGVTDDEAWETYWKAQGGIRMTGMPGFQGRLTDTQLWQVTLLLKDADKLPNSVKAALVAPPAVAADPVAPAPQPVSAKPASAKPAKH
ncbi:MAG TPA: cytochrome c [Candidatus Acidoferrales bacterium]|nr:cytochrome c [Candidatus Acidoferrales bacterium]